MRNYLVTASLIALAACAPSIPESGPDTGSGVCFGNYDEYEARREAELAGNPLPPANTVSTEPLSATSTSETEQVAADVRAALDDDSAERAANSGEAVVHASPDNAPPAVVNSAGISNENDFEAVGEQR